MNETRARELLLLAADTIDVAPAGPLDTASVHRRPWLPALAAAAVVLVALGLTAYALGRDDDAGPTPAEIPTATEPPPEGSAAEQFLAFATGPLDGTTTIFADDVTVVVDGFDREVTGSELAIREAWHNRCGPFDDCEADDWLDFVGEQGVSLDLAGGCGPPGSPVGPRLPSGSHVEVLWLGCDVVVTLGVLPDGRVATVGLDRRSTTVEVPEVRGLYRNEATRELREAGFTVMIATVDTEQCHDENLVVTQRPEAGTQVAAGSTVSIEVNHETEDPAFCGGDPLAPPEG